MPELPEVETVVRGLRKQGLVNAVITGIDVRWPRAVSGLAPAAFVKALIGRAVTGVMRRAKYIVITLDSGVRLLIHLRMTGKLRFLPAGERPGKHDHVVITFDGQRRLVFNDTRKFGRFLLCPACQPLLTSPQTGHSA